jgi:hypothetical protein
VNAPHLHDEQLSLLLDGEDEDGRAGAHVAACEACGARLTGLQAAKDAVAAATVPTLPAATLDRLIGSALSAGSEDVAADVVPLASRRRPMVPPPAWLVGAAAALAALVGIAGLLRAVDSGSRGNLSLSSDDRGDEVEDAGSLESSGDAAGAGVGAATAGPPIPFPPDVVGYDLADQDDPAELVGVLRARQAGTAEQFATAARSAAPAAAGASEDRDTGAGSSPPTTAPLDRAQCVAEAERLGGARFTALESTATVRWKGQAAEVLVFVLAPDAAGGDVSRQAMVLARPGCALLADPRF